MKKHYEIEREYFWGFIGDLLVMFIVVCALAILFTLSGCASVDINKITTRNINNPQELEMSCHATYKSLFKTSAGIKISACGAKGDAEQSGVDNALSNAILGVISKGLMTGVGQ